MTVTDLDLAGLRDDIQGDTLLPSFADVERRAAVRRRRSRIGHTIGIIGLLAVLVPALVAGGLLAARATGRKGLVTIDLAGTGGRQADGLPGPGVSALPVTGDLVAVDAAASGAVYGLVDVCRGNDCNLQLVSINVPGGEPGRYVLGSLLRSDPRDQLAAVQLTVLDDRDASVSGYILGHAQPVVVHVVLPATVSAQPPGPRATKRPVQVKPHELISVATGNPATTSVLAHQPPVRQPLLTSANAGWWVTGTDPASGHIAVSVSHDQGSTWKTTVLGAVNPNVDVALATSDGVYVYAVYGMAGAVMAMRSRDSGRSWSTPVALPVAAPGESFGVYLAADGSVIAWTGSTGPVGRATAVRSTDRGLTWQPTGGPNGPVVSLPCGAFFTLGGVPQESFDGLHWLPAYAPYISIVA
jgi:hypothetical protein